MNDRFSGTNQAIGTKIRNYRQQRKMTLAQVADSLGITMQQYQKYEKGNSQIPASRLFEVAKILGVELNDFLEKGAEGGRYLSINVPVLSGDHEEISDLNYLIRYFTSLKNPVMKSQVLAMIKALAEKQEDFI